MAHELRQSYGAIVDAKLRKTLVTKDNYIFNTFYEGLPTSGAVKIPVRDGEVAVGEYNRTSATGKELTFGSTNYITAVLSNDVAVNELIDGYESSAVPDNLIADRLDSAGYSLGLYMENDALSTLTLGCNGMDHSGTAFGSTDVRNGKKGAVVEKTLTAANVYQQIVELNQKLDEADVPMDGRYIIVTPATYALLLQDTTHFIRYGDRSQEMLETGAIGEIIGLKVYRSNVLTGKKVKVAYNSSTEDRNVEILAGHPLFATRVEAWKVDPFLKDLNGDATIIGGSAVKGRKIFVHEVTKPQAFAMIVKEHAA